MKCRIAVAVAGLAGLAAGQAGYSAQWTALIPITAEWIGVPGVVVTHPAGPFGDVALVVGVTVAGQPNAAAFRYDPLALQPGMAGNWAFSSHAWLWPGNLSRTSADLLLQVDGPKDATCTVELRVTSFGDNPDPRGFQVDVGNDGLFEVTSTPLSTFTPNLDRRAGQAWPFARGPLLVRVLHEAWGSSIPQDFGLEIAVRSWPLPAASRGDDCGNVGRGPATSSYATNYHLAALPPLAPTDLMALRATGLGGFSGFMVGTRPDTVTFQLPGVLSVPCDMLIQTLFTTSGTVARTVPFQGTPAEWVAAVPLLPPGLEFWVQHVSLEIPWLGFTNRVQIRT